MADSSLTAKTVIDKKDEQLNNKPTTSKQSSNDMITSDLLIIDTDSDSDDAASCLVIDEDVTPAKNAEQTVSVPQFMDVVMLHAFIKESPELEILFKNHLMEPLTFLLLLHDFALELKLSKIIQDCGGWVYNSVGEIDGYTAVLVKDDSVHWAYLGAVFKVSYLQACIKSKKVLDITSFFIDSPELKLKRSFNFMNVIYLKRYSWSSVPDKYISPNKLPLKTYGRSSTNNSFQTNRQRNLIDDESVSSSDEDIWDNRSITSISSHGPVRKNTNMLYCRKEDEAIVKFIVHHKRYSSVKGVAFWKTMEDNCVCPIRTWQSMKERFLKKIVYKLRTFEFLTDKQVKLLEKCVVRKQGTF